MFKKILFVIFFLFSGSLYAQDINANSPKPNGGSKQQKLADKKKLKQQQKIQKGNLEGQKRHLKLQAKNTKKMMQKSKKTSKKWNDKRK